MSKAKTNYTIIAGACVDAEGTKRIGAIFATTSGKREYRGRMFSQWAGPWQGTQAAAEKDVADFVGMDLYFVDSM